MHNPWHSLTLLIALTTACNDVEGDHVDPILDGGVGDSLSANHDASFDSLTHDASSSSACLITCDPDAGRCDYMQEAASSTYETRLAEWTSQCDPAAANPVQVSEVTCGNGVRGLDRSQGLGGVRHYFDAAGRFLGLRSYSDARDRVCLGERYWPVSIECINPKTTPRC